MASVKPCLLPDGALLARYRDDGAYTDCYTTKIAGSVPFAQYVAAFYTTAIFKLERIILKWAVAKPSTDAEAARLAEGSSDTFSAWRVEARCADQLLMSDFRGRTRSWFMITAANDGAEQMRLFFGSAVCPIEGKETTEPTIGPGFRALLGFHKLYSRILLRAARARLERLRDRT